MKKSTKKVAVFGINQSGNTDILIVDVQATAMEIESERHFDMAVLDAMQNGLQVLGTVTDSDPAWSKLAINADRQSHALLALLMGLKDLGFGTQAEINGADAVDAVADLYKDVVCRILKEDAKIQRALGVQLEQEEGVAA